MPESLSDLRARFTQSLQTSGRAHATVIAYSKDVEQITQFLAKKENSVNELTDITSNDLEEFKELLKTQRYTGKSISRKINAIKSFFRYLIAEGLIKDNPAEVVAHPKFDLEPPRILSKLEYRALRDACRSDLRIYAIVEVLLQTGLRISELAVMQLADLDLDRNLILIKPQNSRESRRVPAPSPAMTLGSRILGFALLAIGLILLLLVAIGFFGHGA